MDSVKTSVALDQLIAGDFPAVRDSVTVKSGASLKRGTVLGLALLGAATSAAKAGGNTGGGTLTLDATTPVLAGAVPGIYTVRCIAAATDGGTFRVEAPSGVVLGDVAVGATFADQVKFVLADVGTDFAVGDGFNITIAAGTGYAVKLDKAATDGSAAVHSILAEDVDATSAATPGPVFLTGEFNSSALILASGTTVADIKTAARALSIFTRTVSAQ